MVTPRVLAPDYSFGECLCGAGPRPTGGREQLRTPKALRGAGKEKTEARRVLGREVLAGR